MSFEALVLSMRVQRFGRQDSNDPQGLLGI